MNFLHSFDFPDHIKILFFMKTKKLKLKNQKKENIRTKIYDNNIKLLVLTLLRAIEFKKHSFCFL